MPSALGACIEAGPTMVGPRHLARHGDLAPADQPCVRDHMVGSALHVMLSLRRSSRQVVVANEQLHGANVMGELLGAQERVTYQTRNPLAPRVVETLNMVGCAGQLAGRSVLRGGHHTCVAAC
jgi:hypothetical protein